jgi:hypothetical protein
LLTPTRFTIPVAIVKRQVTVHVFVLLPMAQAMAENAISFGFALSKASSAQR